MILVLHHDTIGADVDLARFGIFGDDAATCTDVWTAVQIVPVGCRKFVEIDVITDHLILEYGPTLQLIDRHGLVSREFLAPSIKIIDAVFFFDAHCRTGAFTGAKYVGNDAKARGIVFEITEQQRRAFFVGGQLSQRPDFCFQIRPFKPAQFAHFFQQIDVTSHVGNVSHEVLLIAVIVLWRDRVVK